MGIAIYDVTCEIDSESFNGAKQFIETLFLRFPKSDIYVACEGAPAHTAFRVFNATEQFPNRVKFLTSITGNKMYSYGIVPCESTKNIILSNLANTLATKSISVAPEITAFCTRNLQLKSVVYLPHQTDRFLLGLMDLELKNVESMPDGKVTGKRRGMQDDIPMALAYAVSGWNMYMARALGIRPKRNPDLVVEEMEAPT